MPIDWKASLAIAHSLPRCGAKARTRNKAPCRGMPMKNGRCRFHGGKSPGAPRGEKHGRYISGKFSKVEKESKTDFYDFVKTLDATENSGVVS
jgi:glucans biosynthesis protein